MGSETPTKKRQTINEKAAPPMLILIILVKKERKKVNHIVHKFCLLMLTLFLAYLIL